MTLVAGFGYKRMMLSAILSYCVGAIDTKLVTAGLPTQYDKIADNIIRLYPKPATSVTAGLKFYFQRTPNYFSASDTVKAPGVAPLLHRGFIIAAAYDGALTLGLANLQSLGVELQKEQMKMERYFGNRNTDETSQMKVFSQNNR